MKLRALHAGIPCALFTTLALIASGCSQSSDKAGTTGPAKGGTVATGDHSHWWCPEHGVPEEECSMCSKDVAKECTSWDRNR